jgi:hypothetical protein
VVGKVVVVGKVCLKKLVALVVGLLTTSINTTDTTVTIQH